MKRHIAFVLAVLSLFATVGFVVYVAWYQKEDIPLPALSLVFEAKTEAPCTGQILVDGRPLQYTLVPSADFRSYSLPLPELGEPITSIRLDPMLTQGELLLRNMAIAEGTHSIRRLDIGTMESLNPQARVSWSGSELSIKRSVAQDYPAFYLTRIYPIRTATDAYPRLTLTGLMALWIVGVGIVLVLLRRLVRTVLMGGRKERLCFAGLFLFVLGARLLCIQHVGESFHFIDPWVHEMWALYLPFLDGNFSWHHLFAPCNEHRLFFTRVLSLGVFLFNGQWDNLVLASVNALMYSTIALGLSVMLWSFFDRKHLGPVVVLIALTMGMPFSWENTVWGFQSQFYFFVGFSVLTFWLLGMNKALSTEWFWGVTAGVCAIFTVGAGITATVIVAGVMVLKMIKEKRLISHHLVTLLACSGIYWIYHQVAVPDQSLSLRSHTWAQFVGRFGQAMAWPYNDAMWLAIVMWLPMVLLVVYFLRPGRTVPPLVWLLIMIGAWCVLNNIGIGIFRGAFVHRTASRYMDLTSMSVVVNGLATLLLLHDCGAISWVGKWGRISVLAWWMLMFAGILGVIGDELLADVGPRLVHYRRARETIRRFIRDDNVHTLLTLQPSELPCGDHLSVATWLRCPAVRQFLPSSVREPVPVTTLGETGFVQNEASLNDVLDNGDNAWSSLVRNNFAGKGDFRSKPLRSLRYPYVEFEVVGDFGHSFGTDQIKLGLEDTATGREVSSSWVQRVRSRWSLVVIRSPCDTPTIVASDRSPILFWLAFKEPREKSSVSFVVGRVLEFSVYITAAGLLLIGFALIVPRIQTFGSWRE
jgi:hypothetical protein